MITATGGWPGGGRPSGAGILPARPTAAGLLEGAGTIGGLLAVADTGGTVGTGQTADALHYLYFYNGNGNVTQVLDWAAPSAAAAVRAHYEYDPYGNRTNFAVTLEYEQPFRFSTNYWDAETGLVQGKYRYYSPALGRWISRDPIEEAGGLSVYAFVENAPSMGFDPLGQQTVSGCCCGPDITQRLFQLLRRLQTTFYALSSRQQMQMCESMIGPDGWDISELFLSGSSSGYAPFETGGCGTGSCAGTVQVFGQCYRSNEVNYALWGKAFSLCRSTIGNWTKNVWRKKGPGEWGWVQVDLDGQPVSYGDYDCDAAVGWVRAWRAVGPWLQRVAPNAAGAGTTDCRVAWTRIGCNLDMSQTAACTVPGCGTGCCTSRYSGPLSAHVGTGDDDVMVFVP